NLFIHNRIDKLKTGELPVPPFFHDSAKAKAALLKRKTAFVNFRPVLYEKTGAAAVKEFWGIS
ncbi:MAG TPA: hypothetical protein DCL14_01310, partial [Ruminococcaceae bacterium]|nr:hypothetical protein [Oscillospiraceae bacterium]